MKEEIDSRLQRALNEFTVVDPSDEEIEHTITMLYDYAPKERKNFRAYYEELKQIVILSGNELFYISSAFWISNLLFLAIGLLSISFYNSNPYITLFLLSPLPFLTGLTEIIRSKEYNLLELEATTKYSLEQLIFSKILIISVFNLFISLFLILWIYVALDYVLFLSDLLIYWILPMTLFAAIGLFTTFNFERRTTFSIMITCWFFTAFLLFQFPERKQVVNEISIILSSIIVFLSVLAIIYQLVRVKKGRFVEVISS